MAIMTKYGRLELTNPHVYCVTQRRRSSHRKKIWEVGFSQRLTPQSTAHIYLAFADSVYVMPSVAKYYFTTVIIISKILKLCSRLSTVRG